MDNRHHRPRYPVRRSSGKRNHVEAERERERLAAKIQQGRDFR